MAASTTWQAACGAIDATAAKAFIVEDWSGTDDDTPDGIPKAVDGSTLVTTGAWAVVRCRELQTERRAAGTYGHRGTAMVSVQLPIQATDNGPETFRRARNITGLIRAEIQTLIGGPTTLQWCDIRAEEITLTDETRGHRGFILCPSILDWSDLP